MNVQSQFSLQMRGWRRRAVTLFSRHALRNNEPALIVLCAPLGACVGLVVVALHQLVTWLHEVDFGLSVGHYLSEGQGLDPHRLMSVPAIGGLLLGLMALLSRRLRAGQIVDPVEANAIYGGRMSFIDSLRLALATLISNAAGASVGMEAAYTQMGSGMLSTTAQFLNIRRTDMRIFVGAGAAAAIAAAFNAPLAGAFYAYELVLGSYSTGALAQVAMASLAGTLVMRGTIGVAPLYLVQASGMLVDHWEYPLFGLLGILGAGIGILTMKLVTWCELSLRHLPTPDWLRPALGGLLLSAIATAYPQVLGSGHGGIQELFLHYPPLLLVGGMLAAKVFASAISIGSGFRGGLFSTSLFLGCLLGATFARLLGFIAPWEIGHHTVFMLVGMGAVAASIVGGPLTMVLLVLEVTGDFNVALGVLAGVVMSSTITRYAFGYSFATWRFHQRGVAIRGAHDVGWVSDLTVGRLMRADPKTVRIETPLPRLRKLVPLDSRNYIFAIDMEGNYAGLIDVPTVHDPDLDDAAAGLVAGDLANARQRYLLPGQDVRTALTKFAQSEMEVMPVLAGANDRHVVGYLTEAYALRRYAQELERRRSAELGERNLFSIGPPVNLK